MLPPRTSSPGASVLPDVAIDAAEPRRYSNDVERSTNGTVAQSDPYNFKNGVKTEDELCGIRDRKKGKKGKELESYHRKQNELIDNMLKPMEVHTREAKETEEASRLAVQIAIKASLIANIALSAIQIYAAVSSLSLSFFATAVDSVFDPLSNLLLYWLHKKSFPTRYNEMAGWGCKIRKHWQYCLRFLDGFGESSHYCRVCEVYYHSWGQRHK